MNLLVQHPQISTDYWDTVRMKLARHDYSLQTIRAYLNQLRAFIQHIQPENPAEIHMQEIRRYLDGMVEKSLSRSTVDQAVNALDFFYREVYGRELDLNGFKRPRKVRRSPEMLSPKEVMRIAVSAENLKHRLMIELAFSAGLRVCELVMVKVGHLNLERLLLFVPGNGRDRKSRTTIFSAGLTDALARQIGNKKSHEFLFPSEKGGRLLTRSVGKFFKSAHEASGISKPATPHSLRRSFAAALLKSGSDPVKVQTLLGKKTQA